MAGYNHRRGISNNALEAYRRNLKPITGSRPRTSATPTFPSRWASPDGWPRRGTGSPLPGIILRSTITRTTRSSTRKYAVWESAKRHRYITGWIPFEGELDDGGWIHLTDGTGKKAYSKWVNFRRLHPSRRARRRRAKQRDKTTPDQSSC